MSMQRGKEKVVLAALVGAFDGQENIPSREDIATRAAALSPSWDIPVISRISSPKRNRPYLSV